MGITSSNVMGMERGWKLFKPLHFFAGREGFCVLHKAAILEVIATKGFLDFF